MHRYTIRLIFASNFLRHFIVIGYHGGTWDRYSFNRDHGEGSHNGYGFLHRKNVPYLSSSLVIEWVRWIVDLVNPFKPSVIHVMYIRSVAEDLVVISGKSSDVEEPVQRWQFLMQSKRKDRRVDEQSMRQHIVREHNMQRHH
ncbi:unnamed protein product [Peniophora sp. CBMAI 1063]|nr:unnamed protein product [Peniophora sp. CBMAI 1063]